MFELAFCFCVSTEAKRWPEQILRLGTAITYRPGRRAERRKMEEERKTKEIDGKAYIYEKSTLLTDIWVPLNENGEPIEGQCYIEPKNRCCSALVSLSDRFYDLLVGHPIAVLVVVILSLIYIATYFASLAYVCRVGLQDGWFMYSIIGICVIASAVFLKELLYELKGRRMVDKEDEDD